MAQDTMATTAVGSSEKHVYIKTRIGVGNAVEKTRKTDRGNVKRLCCCGGDRRPKWFLIWLKKNNEEKLIDRIAIVVHCLDVNATRLHGLFVHVMYVIHVP